MMPSKRRKLLTVGLLAVALVAFSGGTANAWWAIGIGWGWGPGWGVGCGVGWGRGWGCGWGGYSTCYTPCYTPGCYSRCSPCWSYGDWCCQGGAACDRDSLPPNEPPVTTDASPVLTETSGLLAISVPSDARVVINGRETTSTGTHRQYYSENLEPGRTYPYEIRATRVVDGRTVEDRRMVYLTAGKAQRLAIDFSRQSATGLASTW